MSDIYEKVFGNMKHVLTHGGYIEDCEGNACCDGTPVAFATPTEAEYDEHLKGVLKWNSEDVLFEIEDSEGILVRVKDTVWFKKEPGYNVIVNKEDRND